MTVCDGCRMVFNEQTINSHDCQGRFTQLPLAEMARRIFESHKSALDEMLESGECVKAYYDQELAKLHAKYNKQIDISETEDGSKEPTE